MDGGRGVIKQRGPGRWVKFMLGKRTINHGANNFFILSGRFRVASSMVIPVIIFLIITIVIILIIIIINIICLSFCINIYNYDNYC